jgi:REP element-mobilizing transposase RayT
MSSDPTNTQSHFLSASSSSSSHFANAFCSMSGRFEASLNAFSNSVVIIHLSVLKENSQKKEIYINFINCVEDHCHILISLGAGQTISEVARLIKGESSNWVNKSKLSRTSFKWQEEYIAVSVSESQVNNVRNYIKNQEEHHRVKTSLEEYNLFIERYGFKELG